MALISCPECANEISDDAISCPKCGAQLKRIVLSNGAVKAICYVTDILSFLMLLSRNATILMWVPLFWVIAFSAYCSSKDEEKYDIDYYKKLRKASFIDFGIVFAFALLGAILRTI